VIGVVTLATASIPTQLAVLTQPPAAVTSGKGFGLVVEVENSAGALDLDYSGTVSIALENDPGDDTLEGTLTATVNHGEGVFAGLRLQNAATGYTIQATATGLASVTTNPFDVTTGATELIVTVQPPTTVYVNNAFGLTVSAEDDLGNVDTAYNGAIALALRNNPGSGTLGGVLVVGANDGVATFAGLSLNEINFGYTILASSGTLTQASTIGFNVTAGPATQLQVATGGEPPSSVVAGGPFSVSIVADDQDGDLATDFNGSVTLALVKGGSVTLHGNTAKNAQAGQVTFSGLSIDTPADYQIQATSSGLSPTISQSITIVPAAARSFTVTTSFGNPDPAGTVGTVTVTAIDPYNNVVSSGPDQYENTVNLSSIDPQVTGLPPSYTFTAADAGSHTFANVALKTMGSQTITATDSGTSTIAGTSAGVRVTPGQAFAIFITTQPPGRIVAGKMFSLTVDADDQFGNVDTSYTGQVMLALASGSSGMLTGTLMMNATAGVAIFNNLVDATSGSISIKATSGSLIGDSANDIPVDPAPADHFVVTTSLTSQDVAGTVGTVTVAEADQFGNIEDSGPNQYEGTVNLFSTDSRATGLPMSYTFTAADAGSHTFTGVILKTAGNQTITATDFVNTTITGNVSVNVIPAPASAMVITSPALNLVAGSRGQVTVQLEDAYDNLGAVSNSAQTINLTMTSTAGAFYATQSSVTPITSVVISVGQTSGSFYYTDTKAGTPTLTTSDSAFSPSPTQLETVNPAIVKDFVVTTSVASPDVAGTTGTVTVTAEDQYTNVVGSGPNQYEGTVDLSSTDTKAAGLLTSSTFTAGDAGTHTFDNVILKTARSQTITATDFLNSTIGGNVTVNVVPAKFQEFVVATSFANPDVAGTAGTVTVVAKDAYGNTVGSGPNEYRGTVALTGTDAQAAGLLASHTFSATDAGSYTFAGVVMKTKGTQTISAAEPVNPSIVGTDAVTVVPAPAKELVVTTPPPNPVSPGRAFTMGVSAEDAYGNVVSSYNGSVTVSLGNDTAFTTTVKAVNGEAMFTGLTVSAADQGSAITVTASGLPPVTTPPIPILASPTIVLHQVLMTQKLKKAKKVGTPVFRGFRFEFNMPVEISNATIDVYSTIKKHGKKKTAMWELAERA
jgi:dUTPase